jgi:hypothetical protein
VFGWRQVSEALADTKCIRAASEAGSPTVAVEFRWQLSMSERKQQIVDRTAERFLNNAGKRPKRRQVGTRKRSCDCSSYHGRGILLR